MMLYVFLYEYLSKKENSIIIHTISLKNLFVFIGSGTRSQEGAGVSYTAVVVVGVVM